MAGLPEAARELIESGALGHLVTLGPDGSPQVTCIWVGLDGDKLVSGHLAASQRKLQNVRRDPRAAICVLSDGFYGEWIQVEGNATVVDLPDAMEMLVSYYRSIRGEHPDWSEYRAAMEQEQRVMLRIALTRAGPDRSG